MIAVDTNILVYAHRADSPFHLRADAVVTALAEGSSAWTVPTLVGHSLYARDRRTIMKLTLP